jgi:hypothetical protein
VILIGSVVGSLDKHPFLGKGVLDITGKFDIARKDADLGQDVGARCAQLERVHV